MSKKVYLYTQQVRKNVMFDTNPKLTVYLYEDRKRHY